jgi:hypothetical protein
MSAAHSGKFARTDFKDRFRRGGTRIALPAAEGRDGEEAGGRPRDRLLHDRATLCVEGGEKLVQLFERLGHRALHSGDGTVENFPRGIEFVHD